MSEETVVVGLKPWLPPPLARSPWWTEPVAAERLAAVRIGVGLVLIADIVFTYLPRLADLFGDGSLTQTTPFEQPASVAHRLLLLPIEDPSIWRWIFYGWALCGALIAAGVFTRVAAAFAWYLSASLYAMNPWLHNAGDQVRTILLLTLIVAPSDAVWTLRRVRRAGGQHILIYPWSLRLLYIQLAAIYFMTGIFKAIGEDWLSGNALAILFGDSGWIRFPITDWGIPLIVLRISVWLVVLWELAFPFLMMVPRLQAPTLIVGVLFHLGTWLTMRVGMFAPYMLCLYLMFVPWERYGANARRVRGMVI